MKVIQLPKVTMNGKTYFVDKRLGQFRNMKDPHDCIDFDEAFVRVRFVPECVVLNDPDRIRKAKDNLRMVIRDAYELEEIESNIDTEPVSPELVKEILPMLLKELEEENEDA